MAHYKCYLRDGLGRIRHVEAIECGDDDTARARASELLRAHPTLQAIELWDGERRIGP